MTNNQISVEEITLEAVKNDGYALDYASEELKADRQIVLEVVKNKGDALEYASEELKSDKEIVLAAVKNEGSPRWLIDNRTGKQLPPQ